MAGLNINELATTDISLTDFIVKADENGLATKNTIQKLANLLATAGNLSFKGSLLIADSISEDGWYFANESGTFTNANNLVITLDNNIAIIIKEGSSYDLVNIPIVTSQTDLSFDNLTDATSYWNTQDTAGRTPFENVEFYLKDLNQFWKWNSALTEKAEFSRLLNNVDDINLLEQGNLIDLNNSGVITDSTMDGNGNIFGGYPGNFISQRMKVQEGLIYTYSSLSATTAIRYEDFNGNLVSAELSTANSIKDITIPTGVSFVRTMAKISVDSKVAFFGKQYTESYEKGLEYNNKLISIEEELNYEYGNLINNNSRLNINNYGLDGNGNFSYFEGLKVSHKIPVRTDNLIEISNPNNLQDKSIDGNGDVQTFSDSIVSAQLPFTENTRYIYDAYGVNLGVRFEDADGNKVGNVLTGSDLPFRGVSPAGTKFVRVNTKIQGVAQRTDVYFGLDTISYKFNETEYTFISENTENKAIRFEDAVGNKIGSVLTGGAKVFNFTPIEGTKNLRTRINEKDTLYKNSFKKYQKYPFAGKKVALYGDSITVDFDSLIYENYIKEQLKTENVQRFGLSGGKFATELQTPTYLTPLVNYDADLVIIHSVNSHRADMPIGTLNSVAGESNDIGGLKTIFDALIAQNPNVEIVFCTPLCYGDVIPLGFPNSFGSTSPNESGLFVSDYVKAYIELCRLYGITIVNSTEKCGFRDVVESSPNKVFTLDGVHPNQKGYQVFAELICDEVNKS